MESVFNNSHAAQLFKTLGDEHRLKILEMLGEEEICACVLLEKLEISQPTLSHHMKLLVESGLVNARKDGRWMRYSLNKAGMQAAQLTLASLMAAKTGLVCDCIKDKGQE